MIKYLRTVHPKKFKTANYSCCHCQLGKFQPLARKKSPLASDPFKISNSFRQIKEAANVDFLKKMLIQSLSLRPGHERSLEFPYLARHLINSD